MTKNCNQIVLAYITIAAISLWGWNQTRTETSALNKKNRGAPHETVTFLHFSSCLDSWIYGIFSLTRPLRRVRLDKTLLYKSRLSRLLPSYLRRVTYASHTFQLRSRRKSWINLKHPRETGSTRKNLILIIFMKEIILHANPSQRDEKPERIIRTSKI